MKPGAICIDASKDYTFDITTDRVYCSRLVRGIVILKNNDDGNAKLLKLNSSLLYGVNSTRFTFNNLPPNIGVIWGSGDSYYNNSIIGSFDYISFYDKNDRIHTANNTYNLFINEIKDVPVAENFTEPDYYDKDALNFYTVECNTPNTGVRFYNYLDEGKEFDELLAGGYKVVEEYNNEDIPDEESVEVEENCKSFKTRKELKEAIVLDNEEEAYSRLEDFGS